MKLAKEDVTIVRIDDVVSLYYETHRVAKNKIDICFDDDKVTCSIVDERLLLGSFYKLPQDISSLKAMVFCNKMNNKYLMVKCAFVQEGYDGDAFIGYIYEILYFSELDLAMFIRTIERFISCIGDMKREFEGLIERK